jgi:hypothetical protein
MTALASAPPIRTAMRRTWSAAGRVERLTYLAGTLLFLSGLVHVGILVASGASWVGPLSYRKAATFGLSFGLTLVTVDWVTSFIRVWPRTRAALLGMFLAAGIVETSLVTMQVWRGVPSHFNFETGFDTAVSMTLAAGGGVIVVSILGLTAAALRTTGSPSMLLALRFGFVMLLGALGVGAIMIADGWHWPGAGNHNLPTRRPGG